MRDEDFRLISAALYFATQKHKNQRRKGKDALPYINHPIDLLHILVNEAEVLDPVALCAALLHDTVEDTDTSLEEIGKTFGPEIMGIVKEVSDDKNLPKDVRKQLQIEHAAEASPRAKLVKLADNISNLRSLMVTPPEGWEQERIATYFDWAAQVVAGVRGTHPTLEGLFDEAMKGKAQFITK